jgi:hypothetical protein
MSKRYKGKAINFTNSEISIIFFIIGLILQLICIKIMIDYVLQYPGELKFVLLLFLLPMAILFFFISPAWINYIISKNELFLWTDRITNPNYIGWIRATKSKQLRSHIVENGPMGRTMGIANGEKADVINQGDYTVTLPNGNKAIIVDDRSSVNINLEQNKDWEMIQKHYHLVGSTAWKKAVDEKQTVFEMEQILKALQEQEDLFDEGETETQI